mmetsp:Transcript_2467/g.7671  ORF Transcript_2467/g.7671 Transcript_2467/m.7671 type:complete len:409 (+) Transcript_2467:1578-2804(+)
MDPERRGRGGRGLGQRREHDDGGAGGGHVRRVGAELERSLLLLQVRARRGPRLFRRGDGDLHLPHRRLRLALRGLEGQVGSLGRLERGVVGLVPLPQAGRRRLEHRRRHVRVLLLLVDDGGRLDAEVLDQVDADDGVRAERRLKNAAKRRLVAERFLDARHDDRVVLERRLRGVVQDLLGRARVEGVDDRERQEGHQVGADDARYVLPPAVAAVVNARVLPHKIRVLKRDPVEPGLGPPPDRVHRVRDGDWDAQEDPHEADPHPHPDAPRLEDRFQPALLAHVLLAQRAHRRDPGADVLRPAHPRIGREGGNYLRIPTVNHHACGEEQEEHEVQHDRDGHREELLHRAGDAHLRDDFFFPGLSPRWRCVLPSFDTQLVLRVLANREEAFSVGTLFLCVVFAVRLSAPY